MLNPNIVKKFDNFEISEHFVNYGLSSAQAIPRDGKDSNSPGKIQACQMFRSLLYDLFVENV